MPYALPNTGKFSLFVTFPPETHLHKVNVWFLILVESLGHLFAGLFTWKSRKLRRG